MRWLFPLSSMISLGVYLMNKKTIDKAVSGFVLSVRSETKLAGVHHDLKNVVRRALELSPFDFGITSGKRTAEEQFQLFQNKASQLDGYSRISRHQTGHAIDYVVYDEDGKVTWGFSYYEQVSWAFKQAARELGVPIKWGGDWTSFKDGPHIELDKTVYP
jgi:peptidoglycan L-alanyl-D-glutamate endopeptidase CwlK